MLELWEAFICQMQRGGEGLSKVDFSRAVKVGQQVILYSYQSRNSEALLSLFSQKEVSWIGPTEQDRMDSYPVLKNWVEAVLMGMPSYQVENLDVKIVCRGKESCGLTADFSLAGDLDRENKRLTLWQRASVFLRLEAEEWKVTHLHISAPLSCRGWMEKNYEQLTRSYRKQVEQLRIERMLYQAVLDLSDDIVVEYDMQKDELEIRQKRGAKVFFRRIQGLSRCFQKVLEEYVFPEDRVLLGDSLKEFLQEQVLEFRLLQSDERGQWHRLTTKQITDSQGETMKVIGRLVNIERERELFAQLHVDVLTGAFNRRFMRTALESYQKHKSPEVWGALLMLDVDNFKSLNDTKGHIEGDRLLKELVEFLKAFFRREDCVGRIGGDEFMVLMKDFYELGFVREKMEKLIQDFGSYARQRFGVPGLGISVGVVLIGEKEATVDQLYQQADEALYRAKKVGKHTYAIYGEDTDHTGSFFLQGG